MSQDVPNDQYTSFIQDIIENPRDETRRLVFADFLEEVGDPRAELLRVQFELDELAPFDRRRKELQRREQKISRQHSLFTQVPREAKVLETYGGFVDHIEITVTRFLKHHEAIFASSPIRKVTLKGKSVKFTTLKDLPGIQRLSHLSFRRNEATADQWREFLTSPSLSNLQGLTVYVSDLLETVTHCVATASNLSQLRHLSISGYPGDDEDVGGMPTASQRLADASHLNQLVSLSVAGQTDQCAEAFSNSENFQNLCSLKLYGYGGFSSRGIRAIQSGSSLRKLDTLIVNGSLLSGHDAFGVESPLPLLRYLTVGSAFNDQAMKDIADRYQQLITLDLSSNSVSDQGASYLAKSPLLGSLKRLVLTDNRLTGKGVQALLDSEYWTKELNLYLRSNQIPIEEIKQLRKEHGSKFGNFGNIRELEELERWRIQNRRR